ncbi:MAG: homoserine kinase [Spongiibacteraceae bacterium]
MAVYTVLERHDVEAFIEPFGIGQLLSFKGIADGVENTTYFISTDQSRFASETRTEPTQNFVLTIFEAIEQHELAFFIELTTFLNRQGLAVPCPLTDANGIVMHFIQDKPALLVPKLKGEHPKQPTLAQCRAIGTAVAQIHLACMKAKLAHEGSHNFDWLAEAINRIRPALDSEENELLNELKRFQQLAASHPELPQTVIHSDLFRDNTLFDQDRLSGIIDFNSASSGYLMFDLAVIVNDWCSKSDGSIDTPLMTEIITAYQHIRPFTTAEKTLWNDFLRVAALRFWVSRRVAQLQPEHGHKRGGLIEPKNPQQYKNILLQRIRYPQPIQP